MLLGLSQRIVANFDEASARVDAVNVMLRQFKANGKIESMSLLQACMAAYGFLICIDFAALDRASWIRLPSCGHRDTGWHGIS
jgi:hypothetical protein